MTEGLAPELSGARWRKSSYSQNAGACVGVAPLSGVTWVRDSKRRGSGALASRRNEWARFVAAVKAGSLYAD